jgi:hypothetical protein
MRRLLRLLIAGLLVAVGLWLAGPAAAQPPAGAQPVPSTTTTLAPPAATVPPDVAAAAPPPRPPVGPGLFDLAGRIREAINGWFRDLVASALDPTLDLVGRSVLATPDLTARGGRVRELWGTSAALANTGYVLLVVVGGLVLMAHESLQTRYAVKDVAPRLVLGMVASNLSLLVVGHAIALTNAISAALLGQGVPPEHVSATLEAVLAPPLDDPDLLLVLVALVVVLGLVLVGCYVVRVALLVLLVVAAPLALACHALPRTEELAQWWWRATAACLGVQVAQSLALITALRVFFQADRATVLGLGQARLVDLLVAVCLLWLLVRIPTWAGRMVFAGRPSTLVGVAKSYLVYRLLRRSLRSVAG